MHLSEIGQRELVVDVALRVEPPQQRRVVELQGEAVADAGGFSQAQVVGDRALGDAQCLGNLPIGQLTLLLEPQNFSNSSHGNPLGRHTDLLVQKRSQRDSRFIESPHTAPPVTAPRLSGILDGIPNILNAKSDMPAKSFNILRKPRSTSSDRRSRSVGNPVQLASEYAPLPIAVSFSRCSPQFRHCTRCGLGLSLGWSHRRSVHAALHGWNIVLRFDERLGLPAVTGSLVVMLDARLPRLSEAHDVHWDDHLMIFGAHP